jgi:phosphatidylserine decarboxylase
MYGVREWLGGGIIALALIAVFIFIAAKFHQPVLGSLLIGFTVLVWLAIAAFFRVPDRAIPQDPALLVFPADGVVKDIELISDCEIDVFKGMDVVRIGIFLSVFDVHVNRAPCDFMVEYKRYREGKYLDARNGNCSKENEAMTIAGAASAGGLVFPVAVRQISGAIARRIVCPPEIGAKYKKGEIYGMIKFGSRTELYLPAEKNIVLSVKVGDRVYSGSSVVGRVVKQ